MASGPPGQPSIQVLFVLTFLPANLSSDPSQTSNEGMIGPSLFGDRHNLLS